MLPWAYVLLLSQKGCKLWINSPPSPRLFQLLYFCHQRSHALSTEAGELIRVTFDSSLSLDPWQSTHLWPGKTLSRVFRAAQIWNWIFPLLFASWMLLGNSLNLWASVLIWGLIATKCLIHALVYRELCPNSLTLKLIHSLAPTFLHKPPSLHPVLQPGWIFVCNVFDVHLSLISCYHFLLPAPPHTTLPYWNSYTSRSPDQILDFSMKSCVTPGRGDLQSLLGGSFLVAFISALPFWSRFNLFLPKCFPMWRMYIGYGHRIGYGIVN